MSSCEYGQIVGEACGTSVDNPANIKSVMLAKCSHRVLPYMGYLGMCGQKGYGFSAVLVINRVSISAILLINRESVFAL